MKHGTRRGFRRARTPVQWNARGTGYFPQAPGALANGVVVTQTLLEMDPTVGSEGIPLRLRVDRIVGDVLLFNPSAAASQFIVSAGIHLADEINGVVDVWDPTTGGVAGMADKSWLWLRHDVVHTAGPTGNAPGVQYNGVWHLDVKAKRIMRPHQRLMFTIVQRLQSGVTTSLNFAMGLRVLTSRPGG